MDQAVPVGSNAVLSVQANNADGYQWQCNGVAIEGQTNSTLVIENAGINNAGSYSAMFPRLAEMPCRPARRLLNAVVTAQCMSPVVGGDQIVVFGLTQGLVVAHKAPVRAITPAISITPRPFPKAGVGRLSPTPQSLRLLMAAGGQIQKLDISGEYGDSGCVKQRHHSQPAVQPRLQVHNLFSE